MKTRILIALTLILALSATAAFAGDRGRLARQLDREGDRIAQEYDARGDRINEHYDLMALNAALHGDFGTALMLDAKGDRINARLDAKGARINRALDRKSAAIARHARYENKHRKVAYRHHYRHGR
ncbi:hypothetical protein GM415_05755 [Pseudodesulfovibrio cashew]|uniref:Uncharacterized protein n=1 Tax=Pseudodesulfovibrio cashew TaxID=2678688 RepID=A0A6I6JEX8_9BACT|nr:hypothetical protein [Pseudodesulfovibrio cashew]QGY39640.1 hypothetical protein GM415_05755 [Pseudodesulfovibrio cashew]